jgi:hypothetical protein
LILSFDGSTQYAKEKWRVAQALISAGGPSFDLAGITNKVGAPSFAVFAKGGYHERL